MKGYKPLFDLFQSMSETATDIYFDNCPDLSEDDLEKLEPEDFKKAFDNACAELVAESINAQWLADLYSQLSDYFGSHLNIIYVQRSLGLTGGRHDLDFNKR